MTVNGYNKVCPTFLTINGILVEANFAGLQFEADIYF